MSRHALLRLSLLTFLVAALAGCSRSPVAPELGGAERAGAGTAAVIQTTDPSPPGGEPLTPIVDQVTLHPNEFGVLRAGRFSLEIPKNSLRHFATITLTQRDPSVMQVEITVTPQSANDFKVPVHLMADCSQDELVVVRHETLFWWQGGWRQARSVALTPATRMLHGYTQKLSNACVDERPEVTRGRAGE